MEKEMTIRHQAELEQLILKYEDGVLPDSTILHAEFGKVVWLIDHQTGSVFTITNDKTLLVSPLVETQEFDKPEKRIYTDRSDGRRYSWDFLSDDFTTVDENCEYALKQRHKLIKMQLLYESSLKASEKIDHDDEIIFGEYDTSPYYVS